MIGEASCAEFFSGQKSFASVIDGHHTDVLLTEYDNKSFLIITQYEKLGTLVQVRVDKQQHSEQSIVYSAEVIFGNDTAEIHAAARFLAEKLGAKKPMLISLCLKDFSVQCVRNLGEFLQREIGNIL